MYSCMSVSAALPFDMKAALSEREGRVGISWALSLEISCCVSILLR
jgi:hypothetical protein